jgi:hypothetical protein
VQPQRGVQFGVQVGRDVSDPAPDPFDGHRAHLLGQHLGVPVQAAPSGREQDPTGYTRAVWDVSGTTVSTATVR